jgi:Pvc16 N-terminal domain
MYTALVASSQTIRDFLTAELKADLSLRNFFDPVFGGTMVVSLLSPEEMEDQHEEGVSLWLYQVVRDEDLLNMPPQRTSSTQYARTPLPVRLHYMVTPLISRKTPSAPELKQSVLGKVLLSLYEHPQFRGPDLTGDFTNDLTVDLTVRLETVNADTISRVWEALERSYELSVSYEVTAVALRPEVVDTFAPVRQVQPQFAVIVTSEEHA